MSIFDSIISENGEKFGLGSKAGILLSALLGLLTDRTQGGFAGFLNRFREAGLGDVADSWVSTGENTTLSGEQVESALGNENISRIAAEADIAPETAKTALGAMIPGVVDSLTPAGEVPDERGLMAEIGNYLGALGGVDAAGAATGNVFDRVDAAAFDTAETDAGAIDNRAAAALHRADAVIDGDDSGNSVLKWLIPLILLGLLVAVGWAFCRKSEVPAASSNVNSNVNKVVTNSSINRCKKTQET
ncbi:MAG: YidB family protein [Pyrinomonadaceae bacterium]